MKTTIEELLVETKYANISIEKLADILNWNITIYEYEELKGESHYEKAIRLAKQQWGRTV